MLLFICHASEDQADFVRPLADELRKQYEVWYSEYMLTLGDQLLAKIDQGLAACDYGVVVLSKPFFAKKWPRAELDGLFARETPSRKIILPIWKDITQEEVCGYSPILASRVAATNIAGIPKIVEEIRLAVSVSDRQRELNVFDNATKRVHALRQKVAEAHYNERMLRSERGAQLVTASAEAIWQTIQNLLTAGQDASSPVKFGFKSPTPTTMYVNTIQGMFLGLHLTNLFLNSVFDTVLEVKTFQRNFDRFGEPETDARIFEATDYKPAFRQDDVVVWRKLNTSEIWTIEELAAQIATDFARIIESNL